MLLPLYTVQRVYTINDNLYGPIHWANNDNKTLCCQEMSGIRWWILTNRHDGKATCKKCIKIFNKENKHICV